MVGHPLQCQPLQSVAPLTDHLALQLPLGLLNAAQGHPMLVELKNGETLNGHLVSCDTWMNLTMKEVVQTSPEADKFMRLPEVYVKGNNVSFCGFAVVGSCWRHMVTWWRDGFADRGDATDQIPAGARRDYRPCEGSAGGPPVEFPGRSRRRTQRGPRWTGRRRG